MRTLCLLPLLFFWATGRSKSGFPSVYKFHTGEWPFNIDFPRPSLEPRGLSHSSESDHGHETETDEVQNVRKRSEGPNLFTTNFHGVPQNDIREDVSDYLVKEGRQILDFTTPSRSKLVRNGNLETGKGAFGRNQDKRIDNTVNGWVVNDPSGTDTGKSKEFGADPIWVVTKDSSNQGDDGKEEKDDSVWVAVQDPPQLDNGDQEHVWTVKDPSGEDDGGRDFDGEFQSEGENSNVLPDSWTVQDITGTEPFTIQDARNPSFTIIEASIKPDEATEYSTDPDSPLNSVEWVDSDNNGWEEVDSRLVEPVEFTTTPVRTRPKPKRPRQFRSKRKPSLFQNWLGWRFGPSQPGERQFFQEWLGNRFGSSKPRERQTIRLRRPSRPYRTRQFHSPRHHQPSHSKRPHRGSANVRFRRPIRQVSNNVFDLIRLRLQPPIRRRRSSSSGRDHSRKTSRLRNKYARKGPMLKKFRPPRHIKIRPSVVPNLHYQKYKEERKTSSKSPKNQRMKSSWWRKPSNILKRSRLRNFSGLKKKYNE